MNNLSAWVEDFLEMLDVAETYDNQNLIYAFLEAIEEESATGVTCDC